MRAAWDIPYCVLCLGAGALSPEHVIPESIGGKLVVPFYCTACNNGIGAKIEQTVCKDPSILAAAEALRSNIPKLAARILEKRTYIGYSQAGHVRGRLRDGRFTVLAKQQSDGSLIQATPKARGGIGRQLHRAGHPPDFVQQVLTNFDSVPGDQVVQIAPGIKVAKWTIDRIEPSYQGPHLPDIALIKMAFEFVACHLYGRVYAENEHIARIRGALLRSDASFASYKIERLRGSYAPFHGLALEQSEPHAVVQVRLFGCLAFRVTFLNLATAGPQLAYTHHLDSGREVWSLVNPVRRVAV